MNTKEKLTEIIGNVVVNDKGNRIRDVFHPEFVEKIVDALIEAKGNKSKGEWIGEADGYADGELVYDVWNCSECNYCIDDGTDDADLLPNYCPNCGAKMKGE